MRSISSDICCVDWCEQLIRNTSAPALANAEICSLVLQAGPTVAITLVRRIMMRLPQQQNPSNSSCNQ